MANYIEPSQEVSIESSSIYDYHPLTTPNDSGPITFVIPCNEFHYMDFSEARLFLKVKILANAKAITDTDPAINPCNNFFHALFEQDTLHLNETQITPTTNLYPYRAYIETILAFNGEYQNNLARTALYLKEEDLSDGNSTAFKAKTTAAEKSKVIELIEKPFIDFCAQNRYLFPGLDART